MSEAKQPMLAADGRPLKRSLSRALRMQKIRALALIAPLLIFVLVTFIAPIADMLFRSVENQIVSETMPTSTALLADWDGQGVPGEDVFAAAYEDMAVAAQRKELTRLGSRLNYEMTGASSLFRKLNRGLEDVGELYLKQFKKHDKAWDKAETWASLLGEPAWLAEQEAWKKGESQPEFVLRDGMAELLPRTVQAYQKFADFEQGVEGKSLVKEEPWPIVHTALYQDLKSQDVSGYTGPQADMLKAAATLVASPDFETTTFSEAFKEIDKDWLKPEIWQTIQTFSPKYTSGYFLNAVDMQLTPDGIEVRNERQRIYMLLFQRTIIMSLAITLSCILLAYPVSYLLSNLPMRKANLLMILVLLPFWTSLLVRTTAWIAMLQSEGVVNDILVAIGLTSDDSRIQLIYNQTGTIVAMTHILLPFMILPLYSVMKTIPPSLMRAARSLGADSFTAFRRVYFPQTVPGIAAGTLLVFILSIGFYITPALVGGQDGQMISNLIAFHMQKSLNWSMAAALGGLLLASVLILYWLYNKLVGVDNLKFG